MRSKPLDWDTVIKAAEDRIFMQDGEPYRNDLTTVRNLKAVRDLGASHIYTIDLSRNQLGHAVLPYHTHGEGFTLVPEGGSSVKDVFSKLNENCDTFEEQAPHCAATVMRLSEQLTRTQRLGIACFTTIPPRQFKSYDFSEQFDGELYNIDGCHRSVVAYANGGPHLFSDILVACEGPGDLERVLAKHR